MAPLVRLAGLVEPGEPRDPVAGGDVEGARARRPLRRGEPVALRRAGKVGVRGGEADFPGAEAPRPTFSVASSFPFTCRVYPVATLLTLPPKATAYWLAASSRKCASQVCRSEPSVTAGPAWAVRKPVKPLRTQPLPTRPMSVARTPSFRRSVSASHTSARSSREARTASAPRVGNVRRSRVSPAVRTPVRAAAVALPSYRTISLSPSRWLSRSLGSVSASRSKSRWSSLPVAIRRCASAGTTRVWSPVRRISTGMCARPSADSKPTIRPVASTTTRSPVTSGIRWSPPTRVMSGAAVAGPVVPVVRASEAAAATVKAPALFTCARTSPQGVRDGVDRSSPVGARGRPPPASAVREAEKA